MQNPASMTFLALRMWWPMVATLTVVGAVLGVLAPFNAPYAAKSLLRVDTSGNEAQSTPIVATAVQLVGADPVYAAVVGDSTAAMADLRGRTVVAVEDVAGIISISVAAPTAEQANRDADDVATKSVEYVQALAQEQLATVTRTGQDAVAEGGLRDPEAEFRRRQALGAAIGERQELARQGASFLTRIGGVQPAARVGLGVTLAGPVGALVGALIGAIAALLLGVRRRRVRRLADVRAVIPEIPAYGPVSQSDGIAWVAARCARLDTPMIALLALHGAESQLRKIATQLKYQLRTDAMRWVEIEADDLDRVSTNGRAPVGSADPRELSVRRRASALAESEANMVLVIGMARGPSIARLSARADIVLLVGEVGRTRLGALATTCARLAPSSPVILLADHPKAAARITTDAENATTGGRARRWLGIRRRPDVSDAMTEVALAAPAESMSPAAADSSQATGGAEDREAQPTGATDAEVPKTPEAPDDADARPTSVNGHQAIPAASRRAPSPAPRSTSPGH